MTIPSLLLATLRIELKPFILVVFFWYYVKLHKTTFQLFLLEWCVWRLANFIIREVMKVLFGFPSCLFHCTVWIVLFHCGVWIVLFHCRVWIICSTAVYRVFCSTAEFGLFCSTAEFGLFCSTAESGLLL